MRINPGDEIPRVPGDAGVGPPPIEAAYRVMRRKFEKYGVMVYKGTFLESMLVDLVRFPGRVKGNKAYAASFRSRINEIQKVLSEKIVIYDPLPEDEHMLANVAFITLTTKSPVSWRSAKVDWLKWSKARERFFHNLRKKGGVKSYAYSVESNGTCGYHVHACIVFDRCILFQRIRGADGVDRWRSDAIRDMVRFFWGDIKTVKATLKIPRALSKRRITGRSRGGDEEIDIKYKESKPYGLIDVQGAYSRDAIDYITKELYKVASCEDSLKRYESGEEIDDRDIKRIYAFAVSSVCGIRLFGTSRDIAVVREPEEGGAPTLAEIALMEGDSLDVYEDGTGSLEGKELEEMEKPQQQGAEIQGQEGVTLPALFTESTNSPNVDEIKEDIRYKVITKKQLFDIFGYTPPPYVGTVDAESLEWHFVGRLLENEQERCIMLSNKLSTMEV